jgi:ectoine hydroxylase-related dioxygenase (phytanoyl-CoA dioxygenase family)
MGNTNGIGSINIRNYEEGYAKIAKESVLVNTSKIRGLIANSNHVKSYLNTPFHSVKFLFSTIPEIKNVVLPNIIAILNKIGPNYRCISSTYYDKPPGSKWELGFHQDVHIHLKYKLDDIRFRSWIQRDKYYQVQPPIEVLENIVAIRIHLDDCKIENGALRIIPESHKMGLINMADYKIENIVDIEMKEGDILKISPLLLHASGDNSTGERRRVIHLEFSNINLPWYEEYL